MVLSSDILEFHYSSSCRKTRQIPSFCGLWRWVFLRISQRLEGEK